MEYVDQIFNEDCLEGIKKLPDNSVDCCITSPPYYGLRDYGCRPGGVVLDPFMGSGTTAKVAIECNRHFVGFELNPKYMEFIEQKIQTTPDLFY